LGNYTLDPVLGRSIIGYEWDFDGDGIFEKNSPDRIFLTSLDKSGNFTIQFRCIDSWHLRAKSNKQLLNVSNLSPIADAGNDMTVFEDDDICFNSTASFDTEFDKKNLLYRWDFGDGSKSGWLVNKTFSHNYSDKGTYEVALSVKDDDNATDTASINITVENYKPTCEASADKIIAMEDATVSFSGQWYDTRSDIESVIFFWDFGDGFTEELTDLPNITHTYTKAGTYLVNLSLVDDDGDSGSSSINISVINVKPQCTAITDKEIFLEDEMIKFTGIKNDSPSDMNSLEYRWDFGDGNSTDWGTNIKADHTFINEGDYNVTLFIKDDDEINSSAIEIHVDNIYPTTSIEVDETTIDEDEIISLSAIEIFDSPSDIDDLTFTWDFGDGNTAQGENILHFFPSSGDYIVNLTITDDNGAEGYDEIMIEVINVKPTAKIMLDKRSAVTNMQILFDASGSTDTPSDLANLTYSWKFGNGDTSDEIAVNHSYSHPGTYRITLVVSDSEYKESDAVEVIVSEPLDNNDDDDDLQEPDLNDTKDDDLPEPDLNDTKDDDNTTNEKSSDLGLFVGAGLLILIIIVVIGLIIFLFVLKKGNKTEPEVKHYPSQDIEKQISTQDQDQLEIQPRAQPMETTQPQPQQQQPLMTQEEPITHENMPEDPQGIQVPEGVGQQSYPQNDGQVSQQNQEPLEIQSTAPSEAQQLPQSQLMIQEEQNNQLSVEKNMMEDLNE